MKPSLSVVVFSKNASQTIERCLHSVRFADEVILIDRKSTDETVVKAKPLIDAAYEAAADYVEPIRNFGISKAHGDWILVIDADEEVSPGLAELIQNNLNNSGWNSPVALNRKNLIFGKWVKHTGWWPDAQVRLLPKGTVSWSETIHLPPQTTDKVMFLPAKETTALIHHHIHTVDEYLDRIKLFTTYEEPENLEADPRAAAKAFFEEFNRRYYALEGYKDGEVGVYLSFLQSFYQFLTVLRLWEKQGYPKSDAKIEPVLRQFNKELRYWRLSKQMAETNSKWYRLILKIVRKLVL